MKRLLLAAVVGAVLIAGCGSDDEEGSAEPAAEDAAAEKPKRGYHGGLLGDCYTITYAGEKKTEKTIFDCLDAREVEPYLSSSSARCPTVPGEMKPVVAERREGSTIITRCIYDPSKVKQATGTGFEVK